jgi:hypothetical protein
MLTIPLLILALLLTGCVGNGALLQDFSCRGKATIVGGGSGFSGINGTIDCGDGFALQSGTKGNQTIVTLPDPNAPAPQSVKVPVLIQPQGLAPLK